MGSKSLHCYALHFPFSLLSVLPVQTTNVFREEKLSSSAKAPTLWSFNPHGSSEHYCNTSKNNCSETANAQSLAKFSHKNGFCNM